MFKRGNKIWVGRHHSEKSKIKMGLKRKGRPALNKGVKYGPKIIKRMKKSHLGNVPWNKGKRGLQIAWNKGKKHPKVSGDKNWNWKGGISLERDRIRHSRRYYSWTRKVFERDHYTDQKYGVIGGELVSHHILNFSDNPKLRFRLKNGITLSRKAHDEFHQKYGKRNNTREQLEEFLTKE
jgi:hypothetical protein